jgi:hypothetical protein
MKYAIRISRLPPCVVYINSIQPVASILAIINRPEYINKPFALSAYLNFLFECWIEIVEDENSLVFTDTRDCEYLLSWEGDKFVATKCSIS